jgi:hypothetical protein
MWMLTRGVITTGLPICFYWTPFLAFTGRVYSSGICVFYVLWPIMCIILAIADAFLEMGMLTIFLIPLWAHKKVMERNNSMVNMEFAKNHIDKVIHKNIKYSSIAMFSCMCGLITLCILEWIANDDGTTQTEHLRVWASFAIAFDNFIGVTAIHCMTSGWLPGAVRKRFRKARSTAAGVDGTTTTSPNKKIRSDDDDKTKQSQSYIVAPRETI